MWRSAFFVPVLDARLVGGAARRGADVIVLDLEAAVPSARKGEARDALAQAVAGLQGAGSAVAVRVNGFDFGGDADVKAAVSAGAQALVLPSATPASVQHGAALTGGAVPLCPLIEDPDAVLDARQIAQAAPSVAALGFGVEDYASAMGAPPTPTLLEPAAAQVIQGARAAGKAPLIIPGTIANFRDGPRFEAAARMGRALGSSGGFAIHPNQVAILNEVFSPTDEELANAQRVVAAATDAAQRGLSVVELEGRMIDGPIVDRARALLASRGPSATMVPRKAD